MYFNGYLMACLIYALGEMSVVSEDKTFCYALGWCKTILLHNAYYLCYYWAI